jgi:excisionase family DNA binding protein
MDEVVLTLEQVAEFLQVSETTVYQLTRSGELPARKVGREWRYLKSDLVVWLRQGGSSIEGKVQLDGFGGEFKIENGQEKVALWLPISREEKRALLEQATKGQWSLSDKVMGLIRELQQPSTER